MKKKVLAVLLTSVLCISGCGGAGASSATSKETSEKVSVATSVAETEPSGDEDTDKELEALGEVEVEKELFDVKLTVPADLVGETTQEELEKTVGDTVHTVTLNDDGSVTYVMSKKQHKEFLKQTKESFQKTLDEMTNSEDYPNFEKITPNDDFTSFKVEIKSQELDMNEYFSTYVFMMYGEMYSIFSGKNVDNIHVDFVNVDSGDVFESFDSKDLEDSEAE